MVDVIRDQVPMPTELRVLSWNIDGLDCELDEDDLLGRALWVIKTIHEERPHVVFLQELIEFNYHVISSMLESKYHIFRQELPSAPYFVGILVHRASADVIGKAVTIPFPTSKMGRDGLAVNVKLKGSDMTFRCITAHLESLRESSSERVRQLELCDAHIEKRKEGLTATIIGGDLNIRDSEVPAAWRSRDCWSLAGSPPEAEYTWDLARNDNARMPNGGKPRCRFDRMYLLPHAKGKQVTVREFHLTGLTRVEGLGRFASDHFGIFTTFSLSSPHSN